jgi:hypothetical protein
MPGRSRTPQHSNPLCVVGESFGEAQAQAVLALRILPEGVLAARAGRGAYAAYVLHALVLVLVSLAARPLPLPPEAKFVLVAVAGVAAAFTMGWAVTRSPLIARFL